MKQLFIRCGVSALLLAAMVGVARAAEDAPKLPGTAATFAGVPWGSSPDTITSTLAQRGYRFVETDGDGDLVFTGTSGPTTANVFEVLDGSKRLAKALIEIQPDAGDVIAAFHALRQSLLDKFGKPSATYEDYREPYRGANTDTERRAALKAGDATLATFWLYADGSGVYVQVTKKLTIEAAYESTRWKAETARGEHPAAKADQSAAAPVFVGPAGWQHVKGTSDGIGSWVRPGDTGYSENISVEAKNGIASLDALLRAESAYVGTLPDQFGYAPTDVTVCDNHPAKYLSFTYTSPSGLPVTSEMVIAVFGTMGYSARYNKSISQDADPAAERSLSTLCGHVARH